MRHTVGEGTAAVKTSGPSGAGPHIPPQEHPHGRPIATCGRGRWVHSDCAAGGAALSARSPAPGRRQAFPFGSSSRSR